MKKTGAAYINKNYPLLNNVEDKEKRHEMESISIGKDLLNGDIKTTLEQIRKRSEDTFL